jgi:FixJ family two-component response regulator
MPGSGGLEFAAQARVLKPLLPIIFFSGFATVADVVAAMRLGAVDFLEKPVEPQDLLGTLQSVRDRYTGAINPRDWSLWWVMTAYRFDNAYLRMRSF